jgi:hypothetical protein
LLRPLLVMLGSLPLAALARDVTAPREGDLSVTVYRAPEQVDRKIELDDLNGFALVTETRTVNVPEGESRIRFEGVADGIEPTSVLIKGLPGTLLEKNRDAQVLKPAALIAASLGRSVMLVRTNPKTGRPTRTFAKIRTDASGATLFETSEGVEALHCSGLPETFSYITDPELSPTPTLTARVKSPTAATAKVTLSYLSRGFDWTANYTATLAADAKSMDLGAWVTLANSNAVGFPSARTQIVAGRVNHETDEVEPLDIGPRVLATCWPSKTTSDILVIAPRQVADMDQERSARMFKAALAPSPVPAAAPAMLVQLEQLGDLKLYRVPERTTLKSRQIKQVRLLDRQNIPVELFYGAVIPANTSVAPTAAQRTVRTRNDTEHHLGLPLPSGEVATFMARNDTTLLLNQVHLRDTAVNEDVELGIGASPDVQVEATLEKTNVYTRPPFLRGILRSRPALVGSVNRVEIHNATNSDIQFELTLRLPDGTQLIAADATLATRNGRQVFKLPVPANRTATVRYQTEHTSPRPAVR